VDHFGHRQKAKEFIIAMQMDAEVRVWWSLLNVCRIYGHVELGKSAAECDFDLEPSSAGHYAQLSHTHAFYGNVKWCCKSLSTN